MPGAHMSRKKPHKPSGRVKTHDTGNKGEYKPHRKKQEKFENM